MNEDRSLTPARLGLGIRGQIYLGFVLMALSLALVTATAGFGLNQSRDNADRFRRLNDHVVSILDIDREIVDLQRGVQLFSYTGHDSLARATRTRLDGVRSRLDDARSDARHATETDRVERMLEHLSTYDATFESAVIERGTRYTLVHDTLPQLEASFLDLANERRRTQPNTANVAAMMDAFVVARINVYRYLADPDYARLTETEAAVDRALAMPDGDSALSARLVEYRDAFARIVRATRGYLYLVGVVMAGEAQELGYLAAEARQDALEQAPRVMDDIDDATSTALQRTIAAATAASLAGAILIGLVGRGLARSIGDITGTLRRLANGEEVTEIPGTRRADEIGVMAQAANAFREQNRRTATLLARQRELAEQIDASRRELERSNDELEQFVYTVSHDLKSPIVTCTGFIGVMKDLAQKGEPERALSKLDVLARANARMSQLTTDLLELSRVGRIELDKRELDLEEVVDDVILGLAPQLNSTRGRVKVVRPMPTIFANHSRLLQALENLLGNALKYGAGEHAPPHVTIWAEKSGTGSTVIHIRDDGPGIDPAYHDRIFALFERLRRDQPGTGVGLAIVAKIMKFHNGQVRVESTGTGDGTTFVLDFPPMSAQEPTK